MNLPIFDAFLGGLNCGIALVSAIHGDWGWATGTAVMGMWCLLTACAVQRRMRERAE